jgi:hypothetical protein
MRIWDGTHLFIWQLEKTCNGDVNQMISTAKDLGITGVLIKFANGSLNGDAKSQAYMDKFKSYAPAFKAAGFVVGGWIFQYLTDVQGEVDACSQAIEAGADWIVLDGEVELNGKNAQVTQFGQLFRAKYLNYPLGLSSFAIANYHPEVPFNEYAPFIDVMMPQIYWAEMGWDVAVAFNASIASFKQYGKPIAPSGQSYDKATVADMAKFVQLCKGAGLTHVSWWDWQEATVEQLNAVKGNIIPLTQPVVKTPSVTTGKTVVSIGNTQVQAFVINGVTFAAVREVLEAVGKEVKWDGQNVEVK